MLDSPQVNGVATTQVSAAQTSSPPAIVFSGRYRVKRQLGAGGMGEVYEATDLVLHRAVAVKIVRIGLASPSELAEASNRLVREARAMAVLEHPNVVAVYDVGTHGDHVFIAMQLIEGTTLRTWLETERAPAEIVRVLRDAGAGLAAAHAAKLVHRDFKPDNVLVSRDGTARVTDFGLARGEDKQDQRVAQTLPAGALALDVSDRLTRTGAVLGTPAYMSPEQAVGEPCTDKSDQFSFCISGWEALYGQRPFAGSTWAELFANITAGTITQPPRRAGVPAAIEHVLRRGLAVAPETRFASMDELLAALDGAMRPRPRYRRTAVLASVLAAAVVAAGAVWAARDHAAPPPATPRTSARAHAPVSVLIADLDNRTGDAVFDGTLEPGLAVALEAAPFVTAYNSGNARKIAAKLRPGVTRLDREVARLVAIREGITGVISGSIERAGAGYRADVLLVDAMSGRELAHETAEAAGKDDVLHAVGALGNKLTAALGDTTPPSVAMAAKDTYTASSLEAAHEYAEGAASEERGDLDAAIARMTAAIARDPEMARAYASRATLLANEGRYSEAATDFATAFTKLERMTDRERARTRGAYFLNEGDLDGGVAELERLVERYPADRAGWINLAWASCRRRDFARAIELARTALKVTPGVVSARSNLGRAQFYRGDFDGARETLEAILSESPGYSRAHRVLALVELMRGHADAARARWQQLAATGPEGAADAQLGLADLALYEGRIADAIAILEPAVTAAQARHDRDATALVLVRLAHARLLAGKASDARAALDQALAASRTPAIELWAARGYVELGQLESAAALARDLARGIGRERQAEAKLIDGEIALARGAPGDAITAFTAASQELDTWLARLDLARAYVAAGAYAQASAEVDALLRRLPEGASALIDEQPTAYLVPQAYYWRARALDGLGSADAPAAYAQFIAIEPASPPRDPLVIDALRRSRR